MTPERPGGSAGSGSAGPALAVPNPSSRPASDPATGAEPTDGAPKGFSLGIGLVLTGFAAVWLAQGIDAKAIGETHGPGPKMFPRLLGVLLAAGGLGELAAAWRARRRATGAGARREAVQSAWPARTTRDVAVLLVSLAAWIAVLPWAGFGLSTWIFACLMLRRFGAAWGLAVGAATGMGAVIWLLFVNLFKVQLPRGVLGLPF